MAQVKKARTEGRTWEKTYSKEEREEYLKTQLDMEEKGTAVYFFTPSLTNSITTDAHLENFSKPSLLKSYSAEITEKVMKLMYARKNNLESRVLAKGDPFVVRALFLESSLDDDFSTSKGKEEQDFNVKRYEHLLKMWEGSGYKLDVRMLPHLKSEELKAEFDASYALIHVPGEGTGKDPSKEFIKSDVGMAFASQATTTASQTLRLHINTPEVETRVVQFERCWSAARPSQECMEIIRNKLTEAKAAQKS